MKTKQIVFYDHNCKICTCFSLWVRKRTDYWNFLPNEINSLDLSGIDIDEDEVKNKIVCFDGKKYSGGAAILKIYSKCGGILGAFSYILLRAFIFYPCYELSYFLFSKNRTKLSFLVKYLEC